MGSTMALTSLFVARESSARMVVAPDVVGVRARGGEGEQQGDQRASHPPLRDRLAPARIVKVPRRDRPESSGAVRDVPILVWIYWWERDTSLNPEPVSNC